MAAGGDVRIVNSTIAGNSASGNGGGIHFFTTTTATLNAVTIARNFANSDNSGSHSGGGIYIETGGTVRPSNSLLALNGLVNGAGARNDCDEQSSGGLDSQGHNLRSDESGACAFDGPGDLVRQSPRIGELAANGGPTKTIALLRNSPAINRAGADAPARDQRDLRRVDPDVGAYERR